MGGIAERSPILVFGPQLQWTPDQLSRLRSTLLEDQHFAFLRDCLIELPDIPAWHDLTSTSGSDAVMQNAVRGAQQLKDFAISPAPSFPTALGNTLLAPLTVVEHTISFIQKARELTDAPTDEGTQCS